MAKQVFDLELDRSGLAPEAFSLIKNNLIRDIIKSSWNPQINLPKPNQPIGPGPHIGIPIQPDGGKAFHVKAEFSKHVKGSISAGKFNDDWAFDPGKFDATSGAIERLKVTVEDVN
ncbi:hypothetical protein [Neorhizobium galegae]|uniref:hypothetical protein n=1 Tax=Neorhizobium galegae TaxID=399 RepID=UPI000622B333|nr:hypothetical protein [Neorhizobium galegae]KAB1122248.1 hypothetical protein F4V90_20425 [Neorhizobium galegae]MCQ1805807.1 hypothetical protein [Neorhizobium galegae]CDZ58104.1 Hypothetical protein NGAL_HAMBI2566_26610 [Neorhizobium galegae bv. orientalis]